MKGSQRMEFLFSVFFNTFVVYEVAKCVADCWMSVLEMEGLYDRNIWQY